MLRQDKKEIPFISSRSQFPELNVDKAKSISILTSYHYKQMPA
jgi:hypothetical protein